MRSNDSEEPETRLRVPRSDAEQALTERIDQGVKLLQRMQEEPNMDAVHAEAAGIKWHEFNFHLLRKLFEGPDTAGDYGKSFYLYIRQGMSDNERCVLAHKSISAKVRRMESLRDRLELFDVPASETPSTPRKQNGGGSRKVFLVHGRDDAAKQAAARTLEKLGLEAIILHEQTNRGRTIIEKFELYSDVGYAVILLTPDDQGRPLERGELSPRARQNVVFEMGFFVGKLGRERVAVLRKDDVEDPSDIAGLVYIDMDPAGAWMAKLGREIQQAGLEVDLARIL